MPGVLVMRSAGAEQWRCALAGARRGGLRVGLAATLLVFIGCAPHVMPPDPGPIVAASACNPAGQVALTNAERRAFLHYYSPVILKQADELGLTIGRDWLTQFDFDQDGRLANNKRHWEYGLYGYVMLHQHPSWKIRPTLYTHAIEFVDGGTKSVVLVYHVYHAMQINSIHDWERIEIRLDGVKSGAGAGPGTGETVRYVVITRHDCHVARLTASADPPSFWVTPKGKHVVITQAPWGLGTPLPIGDPCDKGFAATAELRFVDDGWQAIAAKLASSQPALVDNGTPAAGGSFHYVFVDAGDPVAVGAIGALELTQGNAQQLAAGVPWTIAIAGTSVRRLQYELQDTADVLPSNREPTAGGLFTGRCKDECSCDGRDWRCDKKHPRVWIALVDPLRDDNGNVVIAPETSPQPFLERACDEMNVGEARSGYPNKHWFMGTYDFGRDGSFTKKGFDDPQRGAANGRPGSVGKYWYQHDYFSHVGLLGPGTTGREGAWLAGDWYKPACAGFDGRWVQLFAD